MIKIKIKKMEKDAKLPKKQKEGDAGFDAYIYGFQKYTHKKIDKSKNPVDLNKSEYILQPLQRVDCRLGFATEIPEGYYAQIVPRSGLAIWEGLTILNTPATIDSGFRNEWMVVIVNISNKPVKLKRGDRICQIIIKKLVKFEFEEVEKLSESERGLDGLGSTGI